MAGDNVRDGLAAALVGYVDSLHAHQILEHLEVQMRDAADACRAIVYLSWHRSRVGDELADGGGGDVVGDDQGRWRIRNQCDSVVLRQRIETRLCPAI